MKKIHTHLTGIVFVITLLVAVSCQNGQKPKDTEEAQNNQPQESSDRSDSDIFLKAIKIDGIVHLEMYDTKKDTKKDTCKVIDNLLTVVYRGKTVRWKGVKDSNIEEVIAINLIGAAPELQISDDKLDDETLFKLEIPGNANLDTIKYDIVFITTWDTDTTTIDPYLRIED